MFIRGDSKEVLSHLPDNFVDLICTDPPYGIQFMGKDWDKALPDQQIWKECFRVLKEGKLAFAMCSPRQDVLARMIISLEDAGFKTGYTSIYWTYASGFPKAKNYKNGSYSGFQPKPAVEIILVVSKGKTLTWLDDCRIPYQSDDDIWKEHPVSEFTGSNNARMQGDLLDLTMQPNQKGRFPANLLVSDDVLNDGKNYKTGDIKPYIDNSKIFYQQLANRIGNIRNKHHEGSEGSYSRYFDLDKWYSMLPFIITPKASKTERNEGCEDLQLKDMRFFKSHNGTGEPIGTSKTYPDGSPRPESNKQNNFHPTVKPIKLMSYLITLGSRENDLVLDPFVGSGTTYKACLQTHRRCIGIEINKEYIAIAQARVKLLLEQHKLV